MSACWRNDARRRKRKTSGSARKIGLTLLATAATALLTATLIEPAPARSPPAQCMRASAPDQTVHGRLSVGQFHDAADRPQTAFILELQRPVCLEADDPDLRVARTTRIHVYSSHMPTHRRFGALVGRDVTVRGEPFAAHTAHHHAPIIMNVSEIEGR